MAQAGAREKTGARGLLTVWEKLFRDFQILSRRLRYQPTGGAAELVHDRNAFWIACWRKVTNMKWSRSISR